MPPKLIDLKKEMLDSIAAVDLYQKFICEYQLIHNQFPDLPQHAIERLLLMKLNTTQEAMIEIRKEYEQFILDHINTERK